MLPPTCQIRVHRRFQIHLRFEMNREDQSVPDYPECGNYGYDDAVSDDAPDTRLDRPQSVIIRLLTVVPQGF